ncbi:hypothetical protein MP228_010208 [Amoeboaphelidium protococcarum]|nr:hypothetical protein MP228_010208 [Amoeboaphelidium protococcarum]
MLFKQLILSLVISVSLAQAAMIPANPSNILVQNQAYGKDCPMVVILHPSYVATFNGQPDPVTAAKSEALTVLNAASMNFQSTFNIGTPVMDIRVLDASSDAGANIYQNYNDVHYMLQALGDGIRSKSQTPLFRNLMAQQTPSTSNACGVVMITHIDFSGTLGLAYGDYSDQGVNGGVCDVNGYNAAVVTTNQRGVKVDYDTFVQTVTHECGHMFGSSHDSQNVQWPRGPGNLPQCTPLDGNPYLMDPVIQKGARQHQFSECSQWSIVVKLNAGANRCFVDRGQVTQAQASAPAPPPPAPQQQSQPLVVLGAPTASTNQIASSEVPSILISAPASKSSSQSSQQQSDGANQTPAQSQPQQQQTQDSMLILSAPTPGQ